jgi:hypothetical protein
MLHKRPRPRITPQIATALLFGAAGCASSGRPAHESALTAAEWRADLHTLERELPRRHANAFHSVSRSPFDSAIAALDAALPHLSRDSAEIGFRRVVALIGDGHTGLSSPTNDPVLPLRFAWFGDPVKDPGHLELRITHAGSSYEQALGAKVVQVGDSTIAGAYAALATIIAGGETEGSRRLASAYFLGRPLHGLGVVTSSDSVRFGLIDATGRALTLWVDAVAPEVQIAWQSAAVRAPVYLSRPDDHFWFTRLADAHGNSSTVYLAFSEYPGYFEFWRRSRALFAYLDRHHARRLVIDLRDNRGGDFNKVRRLLIPGLRARASVSAPGHLYVLTGPRHLLGGDDECRRPAA